MTRTDWSCLRLTYHSEYIMAAFCFERGGDAHNAQRCRAMDLDRRAKVADSPSEQRELYSKAADLYEELGAQVKFCEEKG